MTTTGTREAWVQELETTIDGWREPGSADHWTPRAELASVDELHALQERRLRLLVPYLYEYSPFCRLRFAAAGLHVGDIRGHDDLANLPPVSRDDMAADSAEHPPWGTYTAVDDAVWRERGWQTFSTSGTTATPRMFRYTRLDRRIWAALDARAIWAMGVRPGVDSVLIAFGYGPHVWLWGVHYACNLLGLPLVTAGSLNSRLRVELIRACEPTVLACTPSYAMYLGNLAQSMGIDPRRSSVRALFCAGEPGYSVPATRARLEEMWDAQLFDFYGCTEASPAPGGYTCTAAQQASDGYLHMTEDAQIWEAVDPADGAPVELGTPGIGVVTNLLSEASPQLRFIVGDYVTFARRTCECECTHLQAVGGFWGRADDLLTIRGVSVFPSAIEDALRGDDRLSDEYQIHVNRADLDVLSVYVEARPETARDTFADLQQAATSAIITACEVRPQVTVVEYGTLPRTEFKAKRVMDERPR